MKRKIAAIFAADVAGYSRLVAEDEEETLRRLASYRAVMDDFVARAGGRIFNTAGDAVLAEFSSAVEAVRCAIDIQESLRTRNMAYPASRQMNFRIGITVGDVVERDGDLLGDGGAGALNDSVHCRPRRANIRNEYVPAPEHKALAISAGPIGFITGQTDDETAKTAALDICQKRADAQAHRAQCELYAVGNTVVFAGGRPPMPPEPWFTRSKKAAKRRSPSATADCTSRKCWSSDRAAASISTIKKASTKLRGERSRLAAARRACRA